MEKDQLQAVRDEIDRVDREMVALFERRMAAVAAVADYKRKNALPICDPAREEAVVAHNTAYLKDEALTPFYASFMRYTMQTSRQYQEKILAEAGEVDRLAPTMVLRTEQGSYPIYVERGALDRVGELLDLDRRVLILTDSGVPADYADHVAEACKAPVIVTLPEGENSKCAEALSDLWSIMLENGFTRTDCVVAVGGGVVGDLAGFAAATFMRGIDFYNIPTTLLSQVDSSIGGKTAVNHGEIKNCVGAFYQPRAVVIDPDVLSTLPPRQIANGLAEAIKMAATCDADLFCRMEASGELTEMLDHIIVASLEIKKRVVEQDATEKSLRRVLNFGHTLGHGIESQVAFEAERGLYHGECVALGMLPMCAPHVRARLVKVLQKAGLPVTLDGLDIDLDTALAAVAHDKKADGDTVNYVYVPEVGEFVFKKATLGEFAALVKDSSVF